jgi:hypothetical protein
MIVVPSADLKLLRKMLAWGTDFQQAPAVVEMRRLDPSGNPFPPDAYIFGNRLGKRVISIRTAWENAQDAAGLNGFQLRDLRHEAASRFEEAGVVHN